MRLLSADDLRTATHSLRRRPGRSVATMFGVIISIAAVVTIVGIGEGVKQQVGAQIHHTGQDLITIRPGAVAFGDHDATAALQTVVNNTNSAALGGRDVQTVRATPQVGTAVPLSVVPGAVKLQGAAAKKDVRPQIIATHSELPQVLKQKIAHGAFFSPEDYGKNVAVVGSDVAAALFGADAPLGETFDLHGQQFIVIGVVEEQNLPPLSQQLDPNNAIFIPFQTAEELLHRSPAVYEILVKPSRPAQLNSVATALTARLSHAHGNVQDFTVLKPNDSMAVTSNILDLLTRLIVGVAAIALLVGGVGIMNIMWLIVAERTREIGIRKAIGATKQQILSQFLAEVVVLSVVGSVLGVIGAGIINVVLRTTTDLQPVWPWSTALMAVVVAIAVGIIFGMAPAVSAARKEPIDALRND